MPQLSTSSLISATGIAVDIVGFGILTYDQIKSEKESSLLSNIRQHIEALDLAIDEMRSDPIPQGLRRVHDVDLGEAQQMLEEATVVANRENRATSLRLIDEIEGAIRRRRPFKILGLVLIALGGIMQVIGAVIPQSA